MAKVKAIPDGYHTLTPFFCVKGAAEAIEFYKKAFGAEERMRMPGPDGSLMHAEIRIGDSVLMLTDAVKEAPTLSSAHVYVNDVDGFYKRATDAGCRAVAPPTNMPWGDRFARLEDRWGNRWSVATHVEEVSEEEMRRRMAQAQAQAGH
jgi:uncharacterized glyoxalase superfamily protein PhnB